MAFDAHKNFARSSVVVAPSPPSSGTSLTVAAGDGGLFPTPPFNVTIAPANTTPTSINAEIARVTARSGDVLTVTRAQEGTVARTILVGDVIIAAITAKTLTDVEAATGGGGGVTPVSGNWTPTLTGVTSATGVTYSYQAGIYIKIGPLVVVWFNLTLSNKGTIVGNVSIGNLPFPGVLTGLAAPAAGTINFGNLATSWIELFPNVSTSFMMIGGVQAAGVGNATYLQPSDLNNNSLFGGMAIYPA